MAAALAAGPAAASADTLALSASPNPARDSVRVNLHVSGETASQQPFVTVYDQQAAGQGCPGDPYPVDFSTFPLVDGDSVSTGSYNLDLTGIFAAGTAQLCAYLVDVANPDPNTGNPPVLATASLKLTVNALHVKIALHVPARVDVGQSFTGRVSATGLPTDASAGYFVDVKPAAGAAHCAATRFQEPDTATSVLDPGSIGSSFTGHFGGYGRYLFCAWLNRVGVQTDAPLAGPVSAVVTVARPRGGKLFRGRTSQGLPIRFRVVSGEAYAVAWKLRFRCSGAAPASRVKTDSLSAIWLDSLGRFIVDYTGRSAAHGAIRGRIRKRTAKGSVHETYTDASGNTCRSGRVTWTAKPARRHRAA